MEQVSRLLHVVRPDSTELRDHLVALTCGLAARGYETIVVGPLERGLREDLSRGGVRWVNMPLPRTLDRREQREAVSSLARLVASAGPTLVHAHGFQAALTSLAALRTFRPRPPLVFSPHGIPALPTRGRVERWLRRAGYRRVLAAVDLIIVASHHEQEAMVGLGAALLVNGRQRVHVVAPGVERRRRTSLFDTGQKRRSVGLHPDTAVVAVQCALEADGPLPQFLRAAEILSDEVPSVEFVVIGGGPAEDQLKALAHQLRLSGNMVFLGARADAADIIATCNVLAAITDSTWGTLQGLQALAREVRVVAADVPALREVFGPVESIPVVPLSDARAFADALRRQLEHVSTEDDGIQTATGIQWGVSEVLVSQDEYDLDQPGLSPRDRSKTSRTDVEQLLDRHSTARSVDDLLRAYTAL